FIYLFSAICQAVLGPEEAAETVHSGWQSRPEQPESSLLGFVRWLVIGLIILLPLYGILLLLAVIFNWKLNPSLVPGILFVVVGFAAFYAMRQMGIWPGSISLTGRVRITLRRYQELDGSLQNIARDLLLGLTYQ